METYLSATANPSFDITSHLSSAPQLQRRHSNTPGTSTPRDLQTRLKLLELYTLHVLPRNEEWDYAREFIMMSEVLDDERKEAFLQALHGLREERDNAATREAELQKQQQEQLEQRRRESEARRLETQKVEDDRRRKEEESRRQSRPETGSSEGSKRLLSPPNRQPGPPASPRGSKATKKAASPPPGLYKRASTMMGSLQMMMMHMGQNMANNPMALLRMVLFLLAFALAFGRRDLRERVRRIVQNAWMKVRQTVGMGVKVSYI